MIYDNAIKIKEFLSLLEGINNKNLPLKMTVKPLLGWQYELSAFVTNVIYEPEVYNSVFITNAFSDSDPKMTVNQVIDDLRIFLKEDSNANIAFEIYGLDKTNLNEQFICEGPEIQNVNVSECEEYVCITIGVFYAILTNEDLKSM